MPGELVARKSMNRIASRLARVSSGKSQKVKVQAAKRKQESVSRLHVPVVGTKFRMTQLNAWRPASRIASRMARIDTGKSVRMVIPREVPTPGKKRHKQRIIRKRLSPPRVGGKLSLSRPIAQRKLSLKSKRQRAVNKQGGASQGGTKRRVPQFNFPKFHAPERFSKFWTVWDQSHVTKRPWATRQRLDGKTQRETRKEGKGTSSTAARRIVPVKKATRQTSPSQRERSSAERGQRQRNAKSDNRRKPQAKTRSARSRKLRAERRRQAAERNKRLASARRQAAERKRRSSDRKWQAEKKRALERRKMAEVKRAEKKKREATKAAAIRAASERAKAARAKTLAKVTSQAKAEDAKDSRVINDALRDFSPLDDESSSRDEDSDLKLDRDASDYAAKDEDGDSTRGHVGGSGKGLVGSGGRSGSVEGRAGGFNGGHSGNRGEGSSSPGGRRVGAGSVPGGSPSPGGSPDGRPSVVGMAISGSSAGGGAKPSERPNRDGAGVQTGTGTGDASALITRGGADADGGGGGPSTGGPAESIAGGGNQAAEINSHPQPRHDFSVVGQDPTPSAIPRSNQDAGVSQEVATVMVDVDDAKKILLGCEKSVGTSGCPALHEKLEDAKSRRDDTIMRERASLKSELVNAMTRFRECREKAKESGDNLCVAEDSELRLARSALSRNPGARADSVQDVMVILSIDTSLIPSDLEANRSWDFCQGVVSAYEARRKEKLARMEGFIKCNGNPSCGAIKVASDAKPGPSVEVVKMMGLLNIPNASSAWSWVTWKDDTNLNGTIWEGHWKGNLSCNSYRTCEPKREEIFNLTRRLGDSLKREAAMFNESAVLREASSRALELCYLTVFFFMQPEIAISAIVFGGLVVLVASSMCMMWIMVDNSMENREFLYVLIGLALFGVIRIFWGSSGLVGLITIPAVVVATANRVAQLVQTLTLCTFLYLFVNAVVAQVAGMRSRRFERFLGWTLVCVCATLSLYCVVEAVLNVILVSFERPRGLPEVGVILNECMQVAVCGVLALFCWILLRRLREQKGIRPNERQAFNELFWAARAMLVLMIALTMVLLGRLLATMVALIMGPPLPFFLRTGENPPHIAWANFVAEFVLCAIVFAIIGHHMRNAYRLTVMRNKKAFLKDTVDLSVPRGYVQLDEETGAPVPRQYQV
jgi:hypothetical protein